MKPLNVLFNDLGGQMSEMNSTNMGDCMIANCNSDIGHPCQYTGPGVAIDYTCTIHYLCGPLRP